ncbi:uncharacterized protein LOC112346243 [Selaginella moellendorffii]|uniref:uncharacterized protein LOC112346243 n=1 Tax=Selaginella moellendorffii TaxID=88036 RepID=UPI000D1C2808|nr:uncharacterized protein LOC112346243 [Selaginella moellendorffii]|eukprot:XP_024530445.1 uncharacterized protein LOC112346243 [Selaginella moellendorffii]
MNQNSSSQEPTAQQSSSTLIPLCVASPPGAHSHSNQSNQSIKSIQSSERQEDRERQPRKKREKFLWFFFPPPLVFFLLPPTKIPAVRHPSIRLLEGTNESACLQLPPRGTRSIAIGRYACSVPKLRALGGAGFVAHEMDTPRVKMWTWIATGVMAVVVLSENYGDEPHALSGIQNSIRKFKRWVFTPSSKEVDELQTRYRLRLDIKDKVDRE